MCVCVCEREKERERGFDSDLYCLSENTEPSTFMEVFSSVDFTLCRNYYIGSLLCITVFCRVQVKDKNINIQVD